jgi:nucleoside-diphosphate-sugar epimerase
MRYLITGATGFVGGHLAQACIAQGKQVSTIARATSNTAELDKLGVKVYRGDLRDPNVVRQALEDVEVVIHSAAKVGNWGPLEEYRAVNVEGLRGLLDACKGMALSRFIHLSSLGVYAARHHYGSDESEPLPATHRDGYTQSKVEAEKLALKYYQDFGIPIVVLRPGFVYGPGDRTVMTRIIDNLRNGQIRFPGGGQRALNTIFVKNLVDAVFLALENQQAVGQIYNLTDGEFVSKERFIGAVADALGLPRPTRKPPLWLAKVATWFSEKMAKLRGATEAPRLNFASLKFIGLNLDFSIEKAKRELGYRPRHEFNDAMAETMAWYKQS